MNQDITISQIWQVSKCYKREALFIAIIVGFFICFFNKSIVPDSYEASSVIRLNAPLWKESMPEVPEIRLSQQDVLSLDNLRTTLIKMGYYDNQTSSPKNWLDKVLGFFKIERRNVSPDSEVFGLQKNVLIQVAEVPVGGITDTYLIKYKDSDKEFAYRFVNTLIESFNEKIVKDKDSEIKNIIDNLNTRLILLEQILEETKKDMTSNSKNIVPRNKEEIVKSVDEAYKTASETRALIIELETKEHSLREMLKEKVYVDGGKESNSPAILLEQKKRQLQDLLKKYTEDHHQVIAVRKDIAALENELNSNKSIPTNPNSYNIRMELMNVLSSLSSARVRLTELERIIAESRSLISSATYSDSLTKERADYLAKVQMEKATVSAKLANFKTYLEVLENDKLKPIEVITPASPDAMAKKPRFLFMAIGLIVGLFLGGLYAFWKSMELIRNINLLYGEINFVPDAIWSSLKLKNIYEDPETGEVERIYSLSNSTSSSKELVVRPRHGNHLSSDVANDVLLLSILVKNERSFLKGAWFTPCVVLSYISLLFWLLAVYLNEIYILYS